MHAIEALNYDADEKIEEEDMAHDHVEYEVANYYWICIDFWL